MSWEFELAAGPYASPTDGPVWDGRGLLFTQHLLLNNSADNRIMRYDPSTGEVTDFRRWTNSTIGLAFSSEGTLYGCQRSGRRVVRFNSDGSTTVLAHKLGGIYHNQPKDLAVDSKGRIWFADPHGNLREAANPQIHDKLDHASVLRMDAPAHQDSAIQRMTYDTDAPAAVLLSQDEHTLFVAESGGQVGGVRELRAYPILDDGTLGTYAVLHAFGSDHRGRHRGIGGMCLDTEGNIIACAGSTQCGPGPMIYVFSPEGRILETHPIPGAEPTNCAFGDEGRDSLYVTTTEGSLYSARNPGRRGWSIYPNGQ